MDSREKRTNLNFASQVERPENKPKGEKCKGLIFRAWQNDHFVDGVRIVQKLEMRLLKGRSCKGCPDCLWMWDEMQDMLDCEGVNFPEFPSTAKEYKLTVTNVGYCHETGHCDEWDFSFIEVQNDTGKSTKRG